MQEIKCFRSSMACYSPVMRHVKLPNSQAPVPTVNTISSSRRPQTCCRAATAPSTKSQLALHIGDTTLQMPFTPTQAQKLDAALAKLLQTFSDKQAAKRPRRWDMMEVRFAETEAGEGIELFEVFCNPNAYATAFDAKLLITVKAKGGLRVMGEGRLSAIKADLDAFTQNSP